MPKIAKIQFDEAGRPNQATGKSFAVGYSSAPFSAPFRISGKSYPRVALRSGIRGRGKEFWSARREES
jgi:hypothetical protein